LSVTVELTKSLFAENVNTRFRLRDANGVEAELELVEVKDGYVSPSYESFSLYLRGGSKVLEQRMYAMRHDAIGEFDLFITPIARDQQGTCYEAVFNRLVKRS
jgi:hypothetical protein